jgi:hypothetical protein
VLVWTLVAGSGVGIYFIVTKTSSSNSNQMDASMDTNFLQPTPDPVFPPYDLEKESYSPTKAPTYHQDDLMDLDAVLRSIPGVNAEKINDTSVPEGQCRYWLTHEDVLALRVAVDGEKRVEQRYILCLFYYYTNGPSWTIEVDLWLDGEHHECDWFGITCDTDYVVGMELDNIYLNGTITEALLSLSSLDLLWLPNNLLRGNIPAKIFDSLVDLKWLDLSNNALTGTIPSGQGNSTLSSSSSPPPLESMYVKGNQLEGGLPFFPHLQRVRAQRNLLTFLDERYATLGVSLIYLYAYNNEIGGSLPSTWNTPHLQIIDMGFNNLVGPLPQELWDLPKLHSLVLDNNQISGNLPATSKCRTLNQVWLNSNQLDGSIPSSFGVNWVNLTSLKLQGNALTGTVSRDHCNYWPVSLSAFSPTLSESSGWELQADCNVDTMQCECCTQCYPIVKNNNNNNNNTNNKNNTRTRNLKR